MVILQIYGCSQVFSEPAGGKGELNWRPVLNKIFDQ